MPEVGEDPPPPGGLTIPVGTTDGFVFRYDGNIIILDDYPQTGGPWCPAVYPNGQTTWFNAGAALAAMQSAPATEGK